MDLTEFAFRLILIFLPGIISYVVIDYYTIHKKNSFALVMLYSLLLGFFNYFIYYLLTKITFLRLNFCFIQNLITPEYRILDFKEIFIVCIISLLSGISISYIFTYKLFYRFGILVGATKRIGPLWNYLMDMKDQEWVIVRDIKNNLMYEGWIQGFSDNSENQQINELFLRDVNVFRNSDGAFYYSISAIYLVKQKDEILIEYPNKLQADYNDSARKEKINVKSERRRRKQISKI